MANPLYEKLKEVDQLIIAGKAIEARNQIRLIVKKPIARADKSHFASLCRRAQLYSLALRILNPLVRPVGKRVTTPTAEEISEYAASLTYIGATEEASKLLAETSPKEAPQSELFQAFAYFAEWNYQDALKPLENYVKQDTLSDYQRLIGKVNLAAALTYERKYESAKTLLEELLITTEELEMNLLNGNLWEIRGQNELFHGFWQEASRCLMQAKKQLEQNKNAGYLFAEKWEVILKNLKSPRPGHRQELRDFKKRAQEEALWEVVRDCDRYEAIAFRDRSLIEKVCFGTPYPAFRKTTENLWGEALEPSESYQWSVFEGEDPVLLNLLSITELQKKKGLKPGLALHRLLVALSSDFYRPSRIAVLHHRLFPREFYHPLSSPKKVHEKIRFLRKWIKACRLPLAVEQKKKYYFWVAKSPLKIELSPHLQGTSMLDLRLVKLKTLLGERNLTTKTVGRSLNLSPRSSFRLLCLGVEQGVLEKRGKGRACAYFWKENRWIK